MIAASGISLTKLDKVNEPVYSTSSPEEEIYLWIQPPLPKLVFDPAYKLVDGIYVQVMPLQFDLQFEPDLEREFKAWDAASDEALLLFESEID